MRAWKLTLVAAVVVGAVASNALAQNSAKKPGIVRSPAFMKAVPNGGDSPNFGLNDEHYVRIGGSEFIADPAGSANWVNTWNPPGVVTWIGYYSSAAGFQHVYGWAHVPGGSLLDYVELDNCDPDGTNDIVMNVYDCDFTGVCNGTPIATVSSANNVAGFTCGYSPATIVGTTANNYTHEYLLDVVFPNAGPVDGSFGLAGAVVGWKYQVSPAPGTATFPDVPTSDPAFQYVEALVASGVTAGCGGGNYCPDNPLTRRQMAVFLSKALGLYWGGY
jgi:hypothetical protein